MFLKIIQGKYSIIIIPLKLRNFAALTVIGLMTSKKLSWPNAKTRTACCRLRWT